VQLLATGIWQLVTEVLHRRLGSTQLSVSVLGFGAAPLGNEYGAVGEAEGQRAVDAAIEHGIDFFDVSPYYGRTVAEERLGRYLQGKRERVVLCTKVGRYDVDPPEGFDFSAARVRRSVEESLRRLRTDVLDVYLAHDVEFGERSVVVNETLPEMARLREEGKVRAVGISGYPLEYLRGVAEEAGVEVVLSYCHWNLLNTRMAGVLGPLAERGMGLINASPLHMGVLTREGPPPWHPAPERVVRAAHGAAEWCEARGESLPDLALRFALSTGPAASTLVGIRTEAEVLANLRALGSPPDPALLAELQRLLAPVKDVEWPVGRAENVGEGVNE
jgi:L-galactose dehydrogenase